MSRFAAIPIEALRDGRLTLQQFRVLAALHSFKPRGSNEVWPSRGEIAERTGMSERKVSDATSALAGLGWIEKTGTGGRSQAARYRLLNPLRDAENPDRSGQGIEQETMPEQDRVSNENPARSGQGLEENPDRSGQGIGQKTLTDPGMVSSETLTDPGMVSSETLTDPGRVLTKTLPDPGRGKEHSEQVVEEQRGSGTCLGVRGAGGRGAGHDAQPALFGDDTGSAPSAPPKRRPPARPSFDFDTCEFSGITETHLRTWGRAYPAVDVQAELCKAAAWLMSNPTNRKSDYLRFLGNWLSRAQDRAPANRNARSHRDERNGYQSAASARQRTVDALTGRSACAADDPFTIDITPTGVVREAG